MEESLQKTADNIMKRESPKAKVVGVVFDTYRKYIEQRKGKQGVVIVEQKLEGLGYPFKFSQVRAFEHYSLTWSVLLLVVVKEVFDWTDKDIFDMGYTAPQLSLLVRVWMRYFLSIKRIAQEAPANWKKHFTDGELTYELHEDKKYLILRINHNAMHPITCIYAQGYFLRIFKYAIKTPNVSVKETKCILRGDSIHEYVISWE